MSSEVGLDCASSKVGPDFTPASEKARRIASPAAMIGMPARSAVASNASYAARWSNCPERTRLAMARALCSTRVPFLAAVSAFANTSGGDLLIGIEATDGVASAIPGIVIPDVDAELLRLSNMLKDSIEPRLPSVEIHAVECGTGLYVLVVRAQRSWLAPHRVTIDNKFYGRNAAGKYPLDVSELRTAFTLSDSISKRMLQFRVDRVLKVAAGETPLPLSTQAVMIIHVIPLSAFADRQNIDVVGLTHSGHWMPLPPSRHNQGNNSSVNLDGLLTFTNAPGEPAHAYAQVFRSGAVEGVEAIPSDGKTGTPYLAGGNIETRISTTVQNYLNYLTSIELPPPTFVFLSFCGMRGANLRHRGDGAGGYYNAGPLREETILIPEVMIGDLTQDISIALRPIFNVLWNAFGLMR